MQVRTFLICRWLSLAGGAVVVPGVPTNPDIDETSTAVNVIFKWTNPATKGTTNEVWSYDVDTNGIQGAFSLLQTVAGTVSQINDGTIIAGDIRLYKVRACNGVNCSAFTTSLGVSLDYLSNENGVASYPIVMAFGFLEFDSITSFSLIQLRTIEAGFFCLGNGNLTSANLPVTTSIGGPIDLSSCPLLATWNAPVLIITDGTVVSFDTSGLNAVSINQILRRGVVSGVTTCDFELAGGTNATPSGQGVIDKTTLIVNGNTVNTN